MMMCSRRQQETRDRSCERSHPHQEPMIVLQPRSNNVAIKEIVDAHDDKSSADSIHLDEGVTRGFNFG